MTYGVKAKVAKLGFDLIDCGSGTLTILDMWQCRNFSIHSLPWDGLAKTVAWRLWRRHIVLQFREATVTRITNSAVGFSFDAGLTRTIKYWCFCVDAHPGDVLPSKSVARQLRTDNTWSILMTDSNLTKTFEWCLRRRLIVLQFHLPLIVPQFFKYYICTLKTLLGSD